jgi:nitrite reductase/ring-hydroxylating ferredoxin subunit
VSNLSHYPIPSLQHINPQQHYIDETRQHLKPMPQDVKHVWLAFADTRLLQLFVVAGVRKEFDVEGRQVLMFWYRNNIYAIEARSPAEGAYSEGFIKAKFTQVSCCTLGLPVHSAVAHNFKCCVANICRVVSSGHVGAVVWCLLCVALSCKAVVYMVVNQTAVAEQLMTQQLQCNTLEPLAGKALRHLCASGGFFDPSYTSALRLGSHSQTAPYKQLSVHHNPPRSKLSTTFIIQFASQKDLGLAVLDLVASLQDYCIECPSTGSLFSLKDGSIVAWYPNNPVLRALTPQDTCRNMDIYQVRLTQVSDSCCSSGCISSLGGII